MHLNLDCELGSCCSDGLNTTVSFVIDASNRLLSEPQPLPGPEAGPRNRFAYCHTPWGSTLDLLKYPDEQPHTEETSWRRRRP